jgi:WhiB family transcriptional regulator, redox-sensing transcriptional regulator
MTASMSPGDWWRRAACQDAEADLFFPISASGAAAADIALAKRVCESCQVRPECLDYALATRQPHGIWGGTTEDERRRLTERHRKAARRQLLAARG